MKCHLKLHIDTNIDTDINKCVRVLSGLLFRHVSFMCHFFENYADHINTKYVEERCGNTVQNCLKPTTPSRSTVHGWCHSVDSDYFLFGRHGRRLLIQIHIPATTIQEEFTVYKVTCHTCHSTSLLKLPPYFVASAYSPYYFVMDCGTGTIISFGQ